MVNFISFVQKLNVAFHFSFWSFFSNNSQRNIIFRLSGRLFINYMHYSSEVHVYLSIKKGTFFFAFLLCFFFFRFTPPPCSIAPHLCLLKNPFFVSRSSAALQKFRRLCFRLDALLKLESISKEQAAWKFNHDTYECVTTPVPFTQVYNFFWNKMKRTVGIIPRRMNK